MEFDIFCEVQRAGAVDCRHESDLFEETVAQARLVSH